MKQLSISILLLFIAVFSNAQQQNSWSVLKIYDKQHIDRTAMPVGGIGTGTVSFSGYGAIIDWKIMSRPAKGYKPKYSGVEVISRAPFLPIGIS